MTIKEKNMIGENNDFWNSLIIHEPKTKKINV